VGSLDTFSPIFFMLRICLQFPGLAVMLLLILTGVVPWKKNIPLSWTIILGILFLGSPMPTWSLENGSSNINFILMVL
jgi:hypothetical protein